MDPVLLQILLVTLPIILPPLIGLVVYFVKRALAKLPQQQQALVESLAESAVQATEQTASAVLNGPGKKQLAVEKVEKALDHYGVKVAPSIINDAIEAAVAYATPPKPQIADPLSTSSTLIMPKVDTKGQA